MTASFDDLARAIDTAVRDAVGADDVMIALEDEGLLRVVSIASRGVDRDGHFVLSRERAPLLWAAIAIPFAITTLIAIFVCALTGPNIIAMIPILMGISFAVGPSFRFISENPIPRRSGPRTLMEAMAKGEGEG